MWYIYYNIYIICVIYIIFVSELLCSPHPAPELAQPFSAISQELQGTGAISTQINTKPTEQPRALRLPLHCNTSDASSWTRNALDSCSLKKKSMFPSQHQAKSKTEQPGEEITPVKGRDMQEGFSFSKRSCSGSAWLKYCPNQQLHFHRVCFDFRLACQQLQRFVVLHSEQGWWKTQAPGRELGVSETLWNRNVL